MFCTPRKIETTLYKCIYISSEKKKKKKKDLDLIQKAEHLQADFDGLFYGQIKAWFPLEL